MRLTEDEKQNPLLVFEHFFEDYRLPECNDALWTMVETCLSTDNTAYADPRERADLLLLFKDLQKFLEAADWLVLPKRLRKK